MTPERLQYWEQWAAGWDGNSADAVRELCAALREAWAKYEELVKEHMMECGIASPELIEAWRAGRDKA